MTRSAFFRAALAWVLLSIAFEPGAVRAGDANLTFHGVAIQGYDPVAYFTQDRAVPGKEEIALTHDGAIYRFSSEDHKAMFAADPGKYMPQYGGYCAYAAAFEAKAGIEPEQFTVHEGKLYLNNNASIRARWDGDRAGFITRADAWWKTQ